MKQFMATVAVCALSTLMTMSSAAVIGWGTPANAQQPSTGGHPASKYYRDGDSVKPSRQRRGGYSYSAQDTINTYGDSRTINGGGANSYRFESYTRQTPSGPFDHGYFFDSGIGINGGNSPYMN